MALNDMAVLYRSHFHSMEIQMELARRSIPFEVRSGVRFFEQAHVKDATAYLRIAVNPRDELAWKRVLRLFPKVGKVTADKVWKAVDAAADPVRALLEGKLAAPKGRRRRWRVPGDVGGAGAEGPSGVTARGGASDGGISSTRSTPTKRAGAGRT